MKAKVKLLIVFLIIFGCKEESSIKWPEIVRLTPEVKVKAHKLEAKIIEQSYRFIYAKDFFVYQDSIMIVLNKPQENGYFVEFFNLNNNNITNRFIRMGNGPGEMLNTIAHLRNNKLFVHDFIKKQIVAIHIDSALQYPNYNISKYTRFSNTMGSPFVTFYKESVLILHNPFYFSDKKLKVDNKAPHFLTYESGDPPSLESDMNNNLYFTYNVSQGLIIPDHDHNRLIYASNFLDELEIYDMDMHPLRLISGPDNLKPSYRIAENNAIVFNKVSPYSYRSYFVNKEHFYLSYIGNYFYSATKLQDLDSWIFKFDWNGNLIESYYSPQYISTISKSDKENTFYGRGFDQEGVLVLWKLTLNSPQHNNL